MKHMLNIEFDDRIMYALFDITNNEEDCSIGEKLKDLIITHYRLKNRLTDKTNPEVEEMIKKTIESYVVDEDILYNGFTDEELDCLFLRTEGDV